MAMDANVEEDEAFSELGINFYPLYFSLLNYV